MQPSVGDLVASEGCTRRCQKKEENMEPLEPEELDSELDELETPGPAQPKYDVVLVIDEGEEIHRASKALSEALTKLDLKKVRAALRDRFRGDSDHQNPVTIEVSMTEEDPTELFFMVSFGLLAMTVTVKAEQFDRTDKAQEVVFQKCIGLLDALCEAPIDPSAQSFNVGGLSIAGNRDEEEQGYWKEIRARWPSA